MESEFVDRVVYRKVRQALNILRDLLQPLRLAEQIGRADVLLKAGASKGRHLDALHLVALAIEVVAEALSALKHLRQLLGPVYRFHGSLAGGIRRIRHTETAWRASRIIPDMLPYYATPLDDVVATVARVTILVPFTIQGSYRHTVYTVSDPGRLDAGIELSVRIVPVLLFPQFFLELVSQPRRVDVILRAVRCHLDTLRHGLCCLAVKSERTVVGRWLVQTVILHRFALEKEDRRAGGSRRYRRSLQRWRRCQRYRASLLHSQVVYGARGLKWRRSWTSSWPWLRCWSQRLRWYRTTGGGAQRRMEISVHRFEPANVASYIVLSEFQTERPSFSLFFVVEHFSS